MQALYLQTANAYIKDETKTPPIDKVRMKTLLEEHGPKMFNPDEPYHPNGYAGRHVKMLEELETQRVAIYETVKGIEK